METESNDIAGKARCFVHRLFHSWLICSSVSEKTEEVSNEEPTSTSPAEKVPEEVVTFKVIFNKKKHDVNFDLNSTIAQFKEHLHTVIGMFCSLQSVRDKLLSAFYFMLVHSCNRCSTWNAESNGERPCQRWKILERIRSHIRVQSNGGRINTNRCSCSFGANIGGKCLNFIFSRSW